jgi:hypothetical protein
MRGGKVGLQAKKRVYTSFNDYLKYGKPLTERWSGPRMLYQVKHYELIDGVWVLLKVVLPERPV